MYNIFIWQRLSAQCNTTLTDGAADFSLAVSFFFLYRLAQINILTYGNVSVSNYITLKLNVQTLCFSHWSIENLQTLFLFVSPAKSEKYEKKRMERIRDVTDIEIVLDSHIVTMLTIISKYFPIEIFHQTGAVYFKHSISYSCQTMSICLFSINFNFSSWL